MKLGDTYYCVLESYPLLPDAEDSKDFLGSVCSSWFMVFLRRLWVSVA